LEKHKEKDGETESEGVGERQRHANYAIFMYMPELWKCIEVHDAADVAAAAAAVDEA